MDNTIIQQGRFTSTGVDQIIQLRADVDWMEVYNQTLIAAGANQVGIYYKWVRGLAAAGGWRWSTGAASAVVFANLTTGGFTLADSSVNTPGTAVTVTASDGSAAVVFDTANTQGMVSNTGRLVRVQNLSNRFNLSGFDFEVGTVVNNVSFAMRWALANVNAVAGAATNGQYRIIPYDPIFYPRNRYVVNITQAASAVVRTSVSHGYTVGQVVLFTVPAAFGMTQIDGLQGTITAVDTALNTFTVDIDSTAFSLFIWPAQAAVPFTFAQVAPVGIETSVALANNVNILGDAVLNTAYIGMRLAGGAGAPGGAAEQQVYWIAGKSFSVDNQ